MQTPYGFEQFDSNELIWREKF